MQQFFLKTLKIITLTLSLVLLLIVGIVCIYFKFYYFAPLAVLPLYLTYKTTKMNDADMDLHTQMKYFVLALIAVLAILSPLAYFVIGLDSIASMD